MPQLWVAPFLPQPLNQPGHSPVPGGVCSERSSLDGAGIGPAGSRSARGHPAGAWRPLSKPSPLVEHRPCSAGPDSCHPPPTLTLRCRRAGADPPRSGTTGRSAIRASAHGTTHALSLAGRPLMAPLRPLVVVGRQIPRLGAGSLPGRPAPGGAGREDGGVALAPVGAALRAEEWLRRTGRCRRRRRPASSRFQKEWRPCHDRLIQTHCAGRTMQPRITKRKHPLSDATVHTPRGQVSSPRPRSTALTSLVGRSLGPSWIVSMTVGRAATEAVGLVGGEHDGRGACHFGQDGAQPGALRGIRICRRLAQDQERG